MWTPVGNVVLFMLFHGVFGDVTPTPFVKYTKEHKVHNIMLYPEKHSWCRPTPIKQIISHMGCHSIEMENNVCVGACFSFSVPRTIPETPGDDRLYYCDSCQPDAVSWTEIFLDCPENPTQKSLSKKVELIQNCSCTSFTCVHPQYFSSAEVSSKDSAFSGDEDFSSESNNVPEIQDLALRHAKQQGDLITNSTANGLEYILGRAKNISAWERLSKYTDQDPELLLQELQMKDGEEEEED